MDNVEIVTGDTLGPYELLVPLAQGGMAAVWAARHREERGRVVALKMMLAELMGDEESRSMLRDEAQNVELLRHPNVVQLLDVGEENDVQFLVMEWVDGEQLNVLLRAAQKTGGMPVELAVAIARQVAEGLHAAHELLDVDGKPMNLVHRDVSPQNILVGYDGLVKLIDFGVAKGANNMHHTTVGQLKGKAAFMAPEQARGQPVDRRTDIFALGTVLYQLLVGKHPFPGGNEFAVMLSISDAKPAPSMRELRPDLPPSLDAAVLTALAKPRDGRFSSALEMARALEAAVPTAPRSPVALASFMRAQVGPRGDKRRQAIQLAVETVDKGRAPARPASGALRLSLESMHPTDNDAAPSIDFDAMVRAKLAAQGPPTPRAATAPPPSSVADLPDDALRPRLAKWQLAVLIVVAWLLLVLVMTVVASQFLR